MCDDVETLRKQSWKFFWQYCSKFIDRGVVFPDASENTGELKWDNPPTYEDRDKFMLFLDKVSKKSTPPSKVDGHTLQNWQTTNMLMQYQLFTNGTRLKANCYLHKQRTEQLQNQYHHSIKLRKT